MVDRWPMEMRAAMGGYGDWFTSHLLRLLVQTDAENRELLRLGFPDHVAAFDRWRTGVGEFKRVDTP